jgi:hypothetical protein
MRITSGGNVGIGTSSPGARLDVSSGGNNIVASRSTGGYAAFQRFAPTGQQTYDFYNVNNVEVARITADASNFLAFSTSSSASERMRIDASGNVGIGTSSPTGRLSVTNGDDARVKIFSNGGSVGVIDSVANTNDATGRWLSINPSGGNVGIGTSSPSDRLTVFAASGVQIGATDGSVIQRVGYCGFGLAFSGTASNHPYVLLVNDTERMRIDPSGNVGIGTSSPGNAKLNTQGFGSYRGNAYTIASFAANSALAPLNIVQATDGTIPGISAGQNSSAVFNSLGFYTSEAERMRIDASGNVLVAKTTSADTTVGSAVLTNGRITSTMASSSADESGYHLYSTGAGAYRFYVNLAGTIFATSTTISAISDQRLKENVRDIDAGLPEIMALKPRKFDWKPGQGRDKKDDRGWIAQEFEQVFPDMIAEWKDPAPEGEEPYKAVNADLIPVLVKAIQEQQAQIEDLKTRIANLENR